MSVQQGVQNSVPEQDLSAPERRFRDRQGRDIVVRPAVPGDSAGACAVLRRSITECCTRDHEHRPEILTAWLGNKTPQNVGAWFCLPTNFALVALHDDVVVGVALLTQAGKLSLCYVVPEALHCGIGKALLHGLEAQARAWGISTVRLHSTASASAFYARNGYTQDGVEKSCYGVECTFFWKQLDAPRCGEGVRKRFCNC